LTGPLRNDDVRPAAALLVVAVCCLYALWLARPELVFSPLVPLRTDLGGHIVALTHLIEESLARGHLMDWSHQWFAGYPAFYFYFPLPAILIAAGTLLVPVEAAARSLAVLAPALLPAATYVFVRACAFDRLHGACAAIAAAAYLTMTTQYIHGGNVLSSVIGEYSFSLGLALAVLYLSVVARVMRGEQHLPALAVLLAATALSHVVPTMFAVAGSLAAFRQRQAMRQVVVSWALGFAVAAFWALPFLVRSPFMASLEWPYEPRLSSLLPLPVVMILPWTVAAAISLRPYRQGLGIVAFMGVTAVAVYLIPNPWFARGRGVPIWHLTLYLWAGLGVAAGLSQAWSRAQRYRLLAWGAGLAMIAGSGIVQIDLVRGQADALLAERAPDAAQYDALIAALRPLEPGRIHWEYRYTEPELFGGPLALAHIPRLVPGMTTTVGLLREGALTAPVFFQVWAETWWSPAGNAATQPVHESERWRVRLQQLGVNYLVTFSDAAAERVGADPELRLIDGGEGWRVWAVPSPLVEPLAKRPVVLRDATWTEEVRRWLDEVDDTTTWRVFASAEAAAVLSAAPIVDSEQRHGGVVASSLGHRTVRFTTSAVGVPHIVRVSYFPNWRAFGAAGPYRTVPGFMMVVPTQPDVLLQFQATWVEFAAKVLSAIGVAALLVLGVRRRALARRKRP
jgi:hypothetical protein